MELDLKYKQYQLNMEQLKEVENEVLSTTPSRPYQEIIEFLENNRSMFDYKELLSKVKNVQGSIDLSLSDGSKVKLFVRDGMVNLGIIYPDNSKFVATWSNIVDDKAFVEKCRDLA